jgi:4-hydroxybutyrate CoA-transferase
MAENGRAIIAMPSITVKKDGTKLSKIKPLLTEGACVTTNRFDVDYIVTEYGIARMKGTATRERAKALIRIAHPDFREELVESFNNMFPEKISYEDFK